MKTTTEKELYYYRACSHNRNLFKCAGHGAEREEHRAFYLPYFNSVEAAEKDGYLPECYVVRGYQGDKITREFVTANAI